MQRNPERNNVITVENRVTENEKNLMQRECVAPPIEQEMMKKRSGILIADNGITQRPAPPDAARKDP